MVGVSMPTRPTAPPVATSSTTRRRDGRPRGLQRGLDARATASVDKQRGDAWATGGMAMTLFNTVATPNANNDAWAYCGSNGSGTMADFSNADSYHPGGVNVLMTDGSVKFIKDTINQRTWWALGTIAGVRSSALTVIDDPGEMSPRCARSGRHRP